MEMNLVSSLANEIYYHAQALLNTLSRIPYDQREFKVLEFTNGKRSVTDIIAYQIGWGKLLIDWYNAGKNNIAIEMPGEGFTKWDYSALANHFYSKYKYKTPQEQESAFKKMVGEIVSFVEKETQADTINALGVWSWCTLDSGKQWPLSKWVRINTVSSYRRAVKILKNHLKS